jgi:hypothetical protein
MSKQPFANTRRQFLKWAGVAFTAPALAGARLGFAQSAAGPAGAKPPAAPPASSAPAAEISPQARALAEVVKARYGKHLTEAQLEEVTKDLDRAVQNGEQLRAAKLRNADEPDFVFVADFPEPPAEETMTPRGGSAPRR